MCIFIAIVMAPKPTKFVRFNNNIARFALLQIRSNNVYKGMDICVHTVGTTWIFQLTMEAIHKELWKPYKIAPYTLPIVWIIQYPSHT